MEKALALFIGFVLGIGIITILKSLCNWFLRNKDKTINELIKRK